MPSRWKPILGDRVGAMTFMREEYKKHIRYEDHSSSKSEKEEKLSIWRCDCTNEVQFWYEDLPVQIREFERFHSDCGSGCESNAKRIEVEKKAQEAEATRLAQAKEQARIDRDERREKEKQERRAYASAKSDETIMRMIDAEKDPDFEAKQAVHAQFPRLSNRASRGSYRQQITISLDMNVMIEIGTLAYQNQTSPAKMAESILLWAWKHKKEIDTEWLKIGRDAVNMIRDRAVREGREIQEVTDEVINMGLSGMN